MYLVQIISLVCQKTRTSYQSHVASFEGAYIRRHIHSWNVIVSTGCFELSNIAWESCEWTAVMQLWLSSFFSLTHQRKPGNKIFAICHFSYFSTYNARRPFNWIQYLSNACRRLKRFKVSELSSYDLIEKPGLVTANAISLLFASWTLFNCLQHAKICTSKPTEYSTLSFICRLATCAIFLWLPFAVKRHKSFSSGMEQAFSKDFLEENIYSSLKAWFLQFNFCWMLWFVLHSYKKYHSIVLRVTQPNVCDKILVHFNHQYQLVHQWYKDMWYPEAWNNLKNRCGKWWHYSISVGTLGGFIRESKWFGLSSRISLLSIERNIGMWGPVLMFDMELFAKIMKGP